MHIILLIAAVLAAFVATLMGFDVFDARHLLGWLSLSILCLALAGLVYGRPFPGHSPSA